MITPDQFKTLLPLASKWAKEQEEIILRDGAPLNESQLKNAEAVGVNNPENIRLMRVTTIPLPENPALRAAAQSTQLITPKTEGLTLRYGIYIRSDSWSDRRLLVHEFVHTFQYERLGGFMPFLQKYLDEVVSIGYPEAPMEQEAIIITAKLVG